MPNIEPITNPTENQKRVLAKVSSASSPTQAANMLTSVKFQIAARVLEKGKLVTTKERNNKIVEISLTSDGETLIDQLGWSQDELTKLASEDENGAKIESEPTSKTALESVLTFKQFLLNG